MHLLLQRYSFLLLLVGMFSCQNKASDFEIYGLTHDHHFNVNHKYPTTFSWKISSDNPNWLQGAYQILVASSEKSLAHNTGDFWDSGELLSENQLFIPYTGKGFVAGEKYYWKVKVWEKNGNSFRWSKAASFVSPLSYPNNWKGRWITYDYKKEAAAPLFRKTFQLRAQSSVVSARLYLCGLGYYEPYLNGLKIGDRLLEPAQTNFDDYAFYTVYDLPVKDLQQENVLGVMLGNGWYNQNVVWSPAMAYGQPRVIAQLIINYKDGHSDTLGTDNTWKWKEGPVISNNIYSGEVYNANLEVTNWCNTGCDESSWKYAEYSGSNPPDLVEQQIEPIRVMELLEVKKIWSPSDHTFIFDFGQNFAGWVRLKIAGREGQKITLRFSESLDHKNNIDPASTGVFATKCVQTDQYICKGGGGEIWEPRFTCHGFRYVEVTGLETKPQKDLLTGVVVYSSMKSGGAFSCSDSTLNKLHDLAVWTIKSNVQGIPTDCPHRERCGWTGDAHTLASALIRNFDARLFLTKYLYDMRSSDRLEKMELSFGTNFHDRSTLLKPAGIPTMIVPGRRTSGIASPDWGTAITQIPWQLYLNYGNLDVLREFYPDMKTWVEYISGRFPDYIVKHGLGDWCPPGGNERIDCPVALSSTAFHYLDLTILTKTAYLFGYSSDAAYYSNRLNRVKEQFNRQFFDRDKNSYGSQTANSMAIQLGLVPEGKTADVVKSIVRDIQTKSNGFIRTGIFGLGRIFPVLAENGAEETAFQLLTKKGNPGFAYMWDNYDATTLWEVLPVDDYYSSTEAKRRSRNHPMNAGYDEWFFRGIAGIHPDEQSPGFKKFVLRPYFTSKLKNARAKYESPYGTIDSSWKWSGKRLIWDIHIPANTSADIYIPKINPDNSILINGKSEGFILSENPLFPDYYLYKSVGSGKFTISIDPLI